MVGIQISIEPTACSASAPCTAGWSCVNGTCVQNSPTTSIWTQIEAFFKTYEWYIIAIIIALIVLGLVYHFSQHKK